MKVLPPLPIVDDVFLVRCVADRVNEIRSGAVDSVDFLVIMVVHCPLNYSLINSRETSTFLENDSQPLQSRTRLC